MKIFPSTPIFASAKPPAATPPPAVLRPSFLLFSSAVSGSGASRGPWSEIVVLRHQPFAFFSSSSSSRSFLFTRFGTSMRTRASTSPLPEPLSLGAPRPLMRISFPSSVPAGIFSETGPSGRRHLDRAAERRRRIRDRHLDDEVVAAPLVDRRRRRRA